MELSLAPDSLSLAPLYIMKRNLDRIFGKDIWVPFETETIGMEFGFHLDELTADKINVLQLLEGSLELFLNDVLFFLHAVNVINNNIADFDNFPMPSSLEVAYAHEEIKRLFPSVPLSYSSGIKKTIIHILTLEGYSDPLQPFGEMGIEKTDLTSGQLPEDTAAKEKAIQTYLKAMNDVHN